MTTPERDRPFVLQPVNSPLQRETARALIAEYLQWVGGVARDEYGLSFDVDAMLRSDCDEASPFAPPHGRLYLVQAGDAAIGVGGLKRLSTDVGELQRMYVKPQARGLGAGRALLQRLLDDARAMGLRTLRLESLKALAAAHALYRSAGFAEIDPYADNSMRAYQRGDALAAYRASALFMELALR